MDFIERLPLSGKKNYNPSYGGLTLKICPLDVIGSPPT